MCRCVGAATQAYGRRTDHLIHAGEAFMQHPRHMLPSMRSAHAYHHLDHVPAVGVLVATPVITAKVRALS